MKLTEKQKRFADYYIETGNATESAIKAGYSKKTAKEIGSENLTKPNISEYIQKAIEEKDSNRIAKQDEILERLTKVLRREEKEYTVVTIKSRRSFVDDKGKKQIIEEERAETVPIPTKISDMNKAAELLGKRYVMWTDKTHHEGNIELVFEDDYGDQEES